MMEVGSCRRHPQSLFHPAGVTAPLQAFLNLQYLARQEHERRGWWKHLLECHQQGRAGDIRSFVKAALRDGEAGGPAGA